MLYYRELCTKMLKNRVYILTIFKQFPAGELLDPLLFGDIYSRSPEVRPHSRQQLSPPMLKTRHLYILKQEDTIHKKKTIESKSKTQKIMVKATSLPVNSRNFPFRWQINREEHYVTRVQS